MRRSFLILAVLVAVLLVGVSVHAALVDMHDGTIYDTDTQLSWLKDANTPGGTMNWDAAVAWAASLNSGGGFAGLTGWRLPNTSQPDTSCSGTYDQGDGSPLQYVGWSCINSEMGHLYYIELGGRAGVWPDPFTNIMDADGYWSGTVFVPEPLAAWYFVFLGGFQHGDVKTHDTLYAWAARPGARIIPSATPVNFGEYFPVDTSVRILTTTVGPAEAIGNTYVSRVIGTEMINGTQTTKIGIPEAKKPDEHDSFYNVTNDGITLKLWGEQSSNFNPPWSFGILRDGDLTPKFYTNITDRTTQTTSYGEAGSPQLIDIRDVTVSGFTYHDALVMFSLDENDSVKAVNFGSNTLGFPATYLPNSNSPLTGALTGFTIYAEGIGMIADGDIDAATGNFEALIELTSFSSKIPMVNFTADWGMNIYLHDSLSHAMDTVTQNNIDISPSPVSLNSSQSLLLYTEMISVTPKTYNICIYDISLKTSNCLNTPTVGRNYSYFDNNGKILFIDESAGVLKKMDTDGTNVTTISTPILPYRYSAFWLSPDRQKIIAEETSASGDYHTTNYSRLVLMNADGTNRVIIKSKFLGECNMLTWEINSNKVFYYYHVFNVISGVYQGETPHYVLIDIPGGTETDLTASAVGGKEENVCFFTKSGNLLSVMYHQLYNGQTGALMATRADVPSMTEARVSFFAGDGEIYFANLDGSNFRRFVENTAPTLGTLTPSVLTSASATAQTFTAIYSDADGYANIKQTYLKVHNTANGIYLRYNRLTNKLYLYNDAGTATVGNCTPGGAGRLTNTQGSLNCAATTVAVSGNNLTVKWNIAPKAAFVAATKKNVYTYVRDMSNLTAGWTDRGDWTIKVNNTAPTLGTLTPSVLTSAPGAAKTFTAIYSDSDGYGNIKQAYLRVYTAANGIYLRYDRTTNKLYLYNDVGIATIGSCTPGGAGTLTNAQGSLNCAATTVAVSGNNLTIKWNITPSAAFVAATKKNVYTYVRDMSNLTAGWTDKGDWTIKP